MAEQSAATLERKLRTVMLTEGLQALKRELRVAEKQLVRVEDARQRKALISHCGQLQVLLARFSGSNLAPIESAADAAIEGAADEVD
jgi:hypothetical protein